MIQKVFAWFRRKREERLTALAFERAVVVRFDDAGISSSYPDGTLQTMPWSKIRRIAIQTNDTGPWGADVWWLLEGDDARCTYPHGATGDPEALAEFPRRFSGFSHKAVIEAMGFFSNARFICWETKQARG